MKIGHIKKLNLLFDVKNWNRIAGHTKVFDRFCDLYENLSDEQIDLILELIERYTWITTNDYNSRLANLIDGIDKTLLNTIKNIYLFPAINFKDVDKTKSGNAIMYMLPPLKNCVNGYENINFSQLNSFDELTALELKDDELLFVVDDYIGTGNTVIETLKEVSKNTSISDEKLRVLSIVIQKDGLELLKNKGVKVLYSEVVMKGISEYYHGEVLEKNVQTMLEIEKRIPKVGSFSFGYGHSESLVTMIKTPNNTFPIFWKNHKKSGEEYKAPFPRF
ncbi:hypothetical protein E0494_05280 [Marinilabiliaceae bacterium JC040]|nr:hypothetical protein [Marinilabiliaceae bacterium JC040]